ncbi:MAG: ShlB/FhaC/HecB family hemolysin secretion/activation protein [Oceanospirillales bacterium]|nr:ShlB/FhaC/HecB family hemolysin secretion/activation protein [Oceanospirillales bacterium]MBR9887057.1 ShlB/FhaC/HecB family hemolysin secretion/activation protein [Oceanospirillales bacterium]
MHQFKSAFFFIMLAGSIHAAPVAPTDAGQLLQDSQRSGASATPMQQLEGLTLHGAPLSDSAEGGPKVLLKKLNLFGNTIFDYDQLLTVLGPDTLGKEYDLAGLKNLANRISIYYRDNGYPFARAFIPAQEFDAGELTIGLLEGRYGEVRTTGDHSLSSVTQGFLMNVRPDVVIDSPKLERSMLLLSDQPGVDVIPVMQPGSEVGKGDLMVSVREGKRYSGSVGLDNFGNRYSGRNRASAALNANGLLMAGDDLWFNLFRTDEETWLGQAEYEIPLGFSGLRASIGYSHLSYVLGAEFDGNGFLGTATTRSLELSYPLIRSLSHNVIILGKYDVTKYSDERVGIRDTKEGDGYQLGIQFDNRDDIYGGGITYGNIFKVEGDIRQSSGVVTDSFNVYKGQLARQQNFPGNFSLFTSLNGQYSDRSVDGSEQLALGGAYGVRAYPQGEGSGSTAWVGQIELRYNLDSYQPFVFYDLGNRLNVDEEESRYLSGTGLGVRYKTEKLYFDLLSAWKVNGGDSLADSEQENYRIWFKTGMNF